MYPILIRCVFKRFNKWLPFIVLLHIFLYFNHISKNKDKNVHRFAVRLELLKRERERKMLRKLRYSVRNLNYASKITKQKDTWLWPSVSMTQKSMLYWDLLYKSKNWVWPLENHGNLKIISAPSFIKPTFHPEDMCIV